MIPKFRAWLKDEQEMQDVLAFDTRGHSFLGIEGAHVTVDGWCDIFEIGKQAELMQSTGLKDKNGVEIFEGDIVLADGVKKIVTFGEQEHEEDFGDLIYYIGFNVYTKMGYSSVIPVEYEVIGNIWENSELLEEQR
ncbi:hypothetical protein EWY09_RS08855 [Enterococcus hirae]